MLNIAPPFFSEESSWNPSDFYIPVLRVTKVLQVELWRPKQDNSVAQHSTIRLCLAAFVKSNTVVNLYAQLWHPVCCKSLYLFRRTQTSSLHNKVHYPSHSMCFRSLHAQKENISASNPKVIIRVWFQIPWISWLSQQLRCVQKMRSCATAHRCMKDL